MKKWKKILVMVLCLMMVQVPAVSLTAPETVQAATVKNGLKKENGKYYYYKQGKKLKNTWRTVPTKVGTKKYNYRYYFGKTGAAYAASPTYNKFTYNVVIKTIGGKKYGFDTKGRMVKGYYVNGTTYKFYAFNTKTGVYDPKRTAALQKASVPVKGKFVDARTLRKYIGKPLKQKVYGTSCYIPGGKDIELTYKYYIVSLGRYPNGKEIVYGVTPR